MRTIIYIISFILIANSFSSCEDVIDLDLKNGRRQLVIDGFINSDSTIQSIRLTKSAAYFLNAPTPSVNNAVVKIEGPNNLVYPFVNDGNGNYNYNPTSMGKLDSIGFEYRLIVEYENNTYLGKSTLKPVPVIDSITYEFEEADLGSEEGYYAQFWAKDFYGSRDFYWIKAYKNSNPIDTLQYAQFILSQDAAFDGPAADGLTFILPIRASITNRDEPFIIGDSCSVELLSMNEDAWNYLIQVSSQANNGGLFATPTANVRSTITDLAGNLQNDVLGVFSISSISRNYKIIQ